MDHQPFKLVRPLSRQLEHALGKALQMPRERLGLPLVDATFTYAVNDHVRHGHVLELLRHKMRNSFIALPEVPSPSRKQSGFGEPRLERGFGKDKDSGAIDKTAAAPVLSLRAARPFLRAVQRFPPIHAATAAHLEADCVRVLQETLSEEDLTSSDITLLWGVAAQLSQWCEVAALTKHFPLVQTLPLQDGEAFTEALSHMCACLLTSSSSSSSDSARLPHRVGLLRDVVGESTAWERAVASLSSAVTAPRERQPFLLPLRTSNLVMLGAALEKSELTEETWQSLFPNTAGPVSLSGLTLHGWYQRAAALAHTATPIFVREGCASAMVADLWGLFTDRGDAETTLLFLHLGLPMMRKQEPLLRSLFLHESAPGLALDNTSTVVEAYHLHMLRRYLDPVLVRAASTTTEPEATVVAPLLQRPEVLINLLLSFSLARSAGEPTPEAAPYADLLLGLLAQSLQVALPALHKTVVKLHDPGHRLDDVVRCWPLMDTVCLAVALERLFYAPPSVSSEHMSEGTPAARPTAFAQGGPTIRQSHREVVLSAIREAKLLSSELLLLHGTARAVATLLLHAPNVTRDLGAYETCLRLVEAHAGDGFSHEQLSQLLEHKKRLGLSTLAVDYVTNALAELPVRL